MDYNLTFHKQAPILGRDFLRPQWCPLTRGSNHLIFFFFLPFLSSVNTPPSTPGLNGSFQLTGRASGLIGIVDMFGFENSQVCQLKQMLLGNFIIIIVQGFPRSTRLTKTKVGILLTIGLSGALPVNPFCIHYMSILTISLYMHCGAYDAIIKPSVSMIDDIFDTDFAR